MALKKITVKASRGYDILIGGGLLDNAAEHMKRAVKAKNFAVITDDHVAPLYGDKLADSLKSAGFSVCQKVFPHGEASKSSYTLNAIYDFLSENSVTRSDCVLALGGGVVGDIAGFAAATYQRGIDYIQIPTSLLAQVDSSVGGKTAIDLPSGKNLVGAFWQPRLVLIDTNTLDTLPEEFFIDGLGEVIKYGMIKSKSLFELLERHDSLGIRGVLEDVIYECVSIKAAVVEADEFDSGERMLLNFGHTLGHAIEKMTNYTGISHGRAISVGMRMITKAAENSALTAKGLTNRLTACLERYGLNAEVAFTPYELAKAALNDKKRMGEMIHIIVCKDAGKSEVIKMSTNEFILLLS
ncbi:MAG: 3-dehydroquinate synthase [Oscillospiraceae bacterium]|nr:3-dehydroquinate synthase [Oscillospiraceae bacterium]